MKKKQKVKTAMQVIIEWCEEKNLFYKDFQKMETLGYVRVMMKTNGDHYIKIIDQSEVEKYIRNI